MIFIGITPIQHCSLGKKLLGLVLDLIPAIRRLEKVDNYDKIVTLGLLLCPHFLIRMEMEAINTYIRFILIMDQSVITAAK